MEKAYYSVGFSSGGIERVGDIDFESKLEKIAKQCNGQFSGSGFGFGQRDYDFEFKTEEAARKFYSELGRRAKAWKISGRFINFYNPKTDELEPIS